MAALTSAAPSPRPTLLRYWTSSCRDYNGRLPDIHVRIEYLEDGILRTTCGLFIESSKCISWHYDQPPLNVDSHACDCADDAGESAHVRGATFEGCESYETQCAIVEVRALVELMARAS